MHKGVCDKELFSNEIELICNGGKSVNEYYLTPPLRSNGDTKRGI